MNAKVLSFLVAPLLLASCFEDSATQVDGDSSSQEMSSSSEESSIQVMVTNIGDDGLVDGWVNSAYAVTSMEFDVLNSDGSEAALGVEYYDLVLLADEADVEIIDFELGMDTDERIGAELFITNLCDGDYNLVLTIGNEAGISTHTESFTITGEGECGASSSSHSSSSSIIEINTPYTYTLGAQMASEPAALDLDAGELYNSSERIAHAAELDLAYGHQTDGGYLMTPAQAEVSGFGDWGGMDAGDPFLYNITSMIDGDIADLTEFPALEDLDYTSFLDEVAVEEGLVLFVMTDTDAMFLVQVNDIVDGAAGSITILAREADS
jgi:hypothetical protein